MKKMVIFTLLLTYLGTHNAVVVTIPKEESLRRELIRVHNGFGPNPVQDFLAKGVIKELAGQKIEAVVVALQVKAAYRESYKKVMGSDATIEGAFPLVIGCFISSKAALKELEDKKILVIQTLEAQ